MSQDNSPSTDTTATEAAQESVTPSPIKLVKPKTVLPPKPPESAATPTPPPAEKKASAAPLPPPPPAAGTRPGTRPLQRPAVSGTTLPAVRNVPSGPKKTSAVAAVFDVLAFVASAAALVLVGLEFMAR